MIHVREHIKLPFKIDRKGAATLISQFVDGVAYGIETGFWKPGDILPTLDEFASATGVSSIVVRHAIRRLVKKGLVNPRPGVGTMVLDDSSRLWLGHVILVDFETRPNFFFSRISGILRERLIKANYLPYSVSVAAEEYDMGPLNAILRHPASLALVLGDGHGHSRETVRTIIAAGVPVMTFSSWRRPLPDTVCNLRLNDAGAMAELAAHCVKAGVRSVAQVRLRPAVEYPRRDWLSDSGIPSNTWSITPFDGLDPIENVQKGVVEFFESSRFPGKTGLPDLLYFDDDYAATAAIISLLRRGVRIPNDVRLVSRTHLGSVPPFPVSLARIEDDPFLCGEKMSDLAIKYLSGKPVPHVTNLALSYCPGATFP